MGETSIEQTYRESFVAIRRRKRRSFSHVGRRGFDACVPNFVFQRSFRLSSCSKSDDESHKLRVAFVLKKKGELQWMRIRIHLDRFECRGEGKNESDCCDDQKCDDDHF